MLFRSEAEGHTPAGLLRLEAALQADRAHQDFNAAGLMPLGIDAAAAPHQGGMHQGLKVGALASPNRSLASVVGQPPAAIEGHAEAMHRAPPEQGLKAHLGGHHIHRLGALQQGGGVPTIGAEPDARMLQIRRRTRWWCGMKSVQERDV